MPWNTVADSDIGGRDEQQDRYLIVSSENRNSHLLVVADGAGGHKKGALAAQVAIDCVRENLASLWPCEDPVAFLNKLILDCNKRVLSVGAGELACTTLVLVFVKGDELFWGHVGDSRLYLIRGREVVFKTTDHSVAELQTEPVTRDDQASLSAAPNGLYMCLGALSEVVPEVASSVAREGDTLLLCSDGLWGQLDMEQLVPELSEQALTHDSLMRWIEKAKRSKLGNSDNITMVAARYVDEPKLITRLLTPLTNLFRRRSGLD